MANAKIAIGVRWEVAPAQTPGSIILLNVNVISSAKTTGPPFVSKSGDGAIGRALNGGQGLIYRLLPSLSARAPILRAKVSIEGRWRDRRRALVIAGRVTCYSLSL
ncbi:hypothetical protein EVAR_67570_1 [Eumeta japonica]|uniref:Uncharacterized protein n=1 Tax=Eumeta variegata TaxID=151549 RepID=A0A4C1ZI10_EUMVA|nr:hypothetical protein EVAR_67570_1 [Eumeta japonica]